MKILHINASDIGSTGKIVQDICREATARNWESVTLFPRRNREASRGVREYATSLPMEQGICRRLCYLYGLHYGCAPVATGRILRILRKEKPDVVHLHSINCFTVNIYKLLSFLKKRGIPTVVTNHAEFFYTGNCPHAYDCEKWKTGCGNCPRLFEASESKLFDRTHTAWKKMQKAFDGHPLIRIVSVSPWVHGRSAVSPILRGLPQCTILNGVNREVFHHIVQADARQTLRLPYEEKIVLHVTANFSDDPNDLKGGHYLVELAKRFRGMNVRFLVAGRSGLTGELPGNITLLGQIMDQKLLAQYYASANLTVVVSKRETFGMTVAEALCCGTPVVGFQSGGSESIAIPDSTEFVPFGDVDALETIIQTKWLAHKDADEAVRIAKEAEKKYAAEGMARNYCELYEELVREGEMK